VSAVLALLLGLGVFLVYDACTSPPRAPRRGAVRRAADRIEGWLLAGGLGSVSPAQFVGACIGGGIAGAAIAYVVVGSSAVALVALVAGTYAPIAYYRTRRRSTRRARQQCWPEAIELLAGAVRAGDT
jgi:tight adherence protein B